MASAQTISGRRLAPCSPVRYLPIVREGNRARLQNRIQRQLPPKTLERRKAYNFLL
jgi:hypothetical protein